MRSKVITFLILSFISVFVASGQNGSKKISPVGTWKFEAPYAPEGYTSGTIVVGLNDQKYSTTMAFAGSESKLFGEKVKAVNDSVLFSVFLQGQDIKVMLKLEDISKMSGKAVYSEGEVPLTLTKDPASGSK
jgi:hypothetical protein